MGAGIAKRTAIEIAEILRNIYCSPIDLWRSISDIDDTEKLEVMGEFIDNNLVIKRVVQHLKRTFEEEEKEEEKLGNLIILW